MSEKETSLNPTETSPPAGADFLGEPEPNQKEFNATDFSCRTLKTTAGIRQSITEKGGQPK